MLMPVLVLLLVGMSQVARITYTYYTLRKTVYAVAAYLSVQQGVNFCDPADPTIAAAINFGISGTTDGSQPAFVTGLTSDMILVTAEAVDPVAGTPGAYGTGCGASPPFDGAPPDQIVVSIPNGYNMPMRIPMVPTQLIPLKPMVKVPYGGT
jgi:hypothetical protein